MATPILVAEYETDWGRGTGTERSVSVAVTAGNVVVVLASGESGTAKPTAISGGGLTWTSVFNVGSGNSDSGARAWHATATSTTTFTITVTGPNLANLAWGFTALVFASTAGVGAATGSGAGATVNSYTTNSVSAGSSLVLIAADWNAGDGASRVWRTLNGVTPSSTNGYELVYYRNASFYTVYAAYWPNVGAAGSKITGFTSPSTSLDIAWGTVEILPSIDPPIEFDVADITFLIPPGRPGTPIVELDVARVSFDVPIAAEPDIQLDVVDIFVDIPIGKEPPVELDICDVTFSAPVGTEQYASLDIADVSMLVPVATEPVPELDVSRTSFNIPIAVALATELDIVDISTLIPIGSDYAQLDVTDIAVLIPVAEPVVVEFDVVDIDVTIPVGDIQLAQLDVARVSFSIPVAYESDLLAPAQWYVAIDGQLETASIYVVDSNGTLRAVSAMYYVLA